VRIIESARWKNLNDLHADFPSADLVGACTVFNIGGNKYRLTAYVSYRLQAVEVNRVMTQCRIQPRKVEEGVRKITGRPSAGHDTSNY